MTIEEGWMQNEQEHVALEVCSKNDNGMAFITRKADLMNTWILVVCGSGD
jgi:hypothetical protein